MEHVLWLECIFLEHTFWIDWFSEVIFGCFLGENSWSWLRSRTLYFDSKCLGEIANCKSSVLVFFHRISAYLPCCPLGWVLISSPRILKFSQVCNIVFGIEEGIAEIILHYLSCLSFFLWLLVSRKRKQGGLSLEEEEEEDATEESEGSSSTEEDATAEQEKGVGAEDARKKKEDELWASFLNDVGPKPKVPPKTQVNVSW